ncbi:hypothetical protein BLNAU_5329 [Blattamonas nauphoetae]|uniref:Uncharacterized protein n=1 Tax=Blattamonas nauphoetae TaxID=2049346 RepID=A0ABQ9Y811_9EUKA|nr:hypothetical protein BLNAU_5329 [Blattamonas nauphoetae]
MLKRPHLKGHAITLFTSTTSEWGLALQDSITNEDLQKGCISLFEQVNSGQNLTQIEVHHASSFLEYAIIHMKHRNYPKNYLFETIFPESEPPDTKLTNALIKLICHPSDMLRTVALSFLDVGLRTSSFQFRPTKAAPGLVPQLFHNLRPHEIPLNGSTIDFHRHMTSILDRYYDYPNRLLIADELGISPSSPRDKTIASEIGYPIFQPFDQYLRHLVAPPVCPTEYPFGISLLRKMRLFRSNVLYCYSPSSFPGVQPFFEEMRNTLTEEYVLLRLLSKPKTFNLLFDYHRDKSEYDWADLFEKFITRMSEGWKFSDLGLQPFLRFLTRRPSTIKPFVWDDGTFSIKWYGRLFSSMKMPTKTLWDIFTPSQLHHADAILKAFEEFTNKLDDEVFEKHFWRDWFPSFIDAVTPSKLPFTTEFESLHKQLIDMMSSRLYKMRKFADSTKDEQSQRELDELFKSFHQQTRDYCLHLSLHPFALVSEYHSSTIIFFFIRLFQPDSKHCLDEHLRDELMKAMDEVALASSTPPFILTSELVRCLTDDEIIDIVYRVVALLESDSCLDDDTILRICAFQKYQLSRVHLPDLFRKAGRSSAQYIHTLESLLSLPIDCLYLSPISSLLHRKPKELQPTFDEWDDVDFETVGFVMRSIEDHHILSSDHSSDLNLSLFFFVTHIVPQIAPCATRLNQSQLERLIAPTIDILCEHYFQRDSSGYVDKERRESVFNEINNMCEQHMITRCLSGVGFFSRLVSGLLDDRTSLPCESCLDIFSTHRVRLCERAEMKHHRRTIPHFLEEGLQDALEFMLVRKKGEDTLNCPVAYFSGMMRFFGANIRS